MYKKKERGKEEPCTVGVRDQLPDHVREGQEESQGLAGPQETTKHYVVEGQSLEDPLESGVCGN